MPPSIRAPRLGLEGGSRTVTSIQLRRGIEMRNQLRTFLAAGLLAVLAAAAAFAGDAWKDKSYDSWDEKDVQKILNDSPWAKRVEFAPIPGSHSPDSPDPSLSTSAGQPGGVGSIADKSGRRGGGAPDSPGGSTASAVYVARWYSSRTIREGIVRAAELHGTTPAEASKPLASTPEKYQIMLIGTDLRAFGQTTGDALQKITYLELKKTKEKVAPSKVSIMKGDDARRILAVVYEFPKKALSGEPTIAADEKNVDFVTEAGKSSLKFHFEIGKMADKQGTDL